MRRCPSLNMTPETAKCHARRWGYDHCFESPALGTDNGKYLFHCHLRRDESCGGSSFNIFWSSALSCFLLPFEKPSILLRYSKTASVIPDRQHHCLDPLRLIQLGESLDQQKPSLR
ncbi:hypothetical protein PO909_030603 [Leuciscus waleckii]